MLAVVAMTRKNLVVSAELAGRIDRVVLNLTGLSRSNVQGLFDHDCVSLNGAPAADPGTVVKVGDDVEVYFDSHRRYHPRPRQWEDDAFKIIFEDKHLIVVDKAAGVLTVPANPGDSNTLVHAVTRYFQHRGSRERAQLVHRLDRGVSGVLVFGKNRDIAERLQSQFEERKPEREYMAIVSGSVPPKGTFESYLATTRSLQQYSTDDEEGGQLAITHYERVKVVDGASWVRVWLETGRRNQIRVHFADAGHPVLGDPRYGSEKSSHPKWRVKRLALHAAVLGFKHPVTGKDLRFNSPMPTAMRAFVGEKARNSSR
jgi:23S rRNA pseudouridine1911/1915/1917 synthase